MKEKIKLRDTNWVIKIGVIGGWIILGVYLIYLGSGMLRGLLA